MDKLEESKMMYAALIQAKRAATRGEVPVGAVLVYRHQILAKAYNRVIHDHNPTAHAEILVLQRGGNQLRSHYLDSCDLYVTLEPCAMCAAAISMAKIRRLIIAADSIKTGAVLNGIQFFDQPSCFHKPEIIQGILQTESTLLLQSFFQELRTSKQLSKSE